jgi:hypothetical protein
MEKDQLWQITVRVPLRIPTEMRDELFNIIADTVASWEPVDRDGWDADVSGAPARKHAASSGVSA